MMSEITSLVRRIEKEFDYEQEEPAGSADVAAAERAFADLFGIEMPGGYRELIGLTDGLDFNGMIIYSCRDGLSPSGYQRLGLAESNERLIEGVDHIDTPLRFVGETGDELFAYHTSAGTWWVVDRVGWDPDPTTRPYQSFDALCVAQIKRFVEML